MDIASTMGGKDKAVLDAQVDAFNKTLNDARNPKQNLGKEDFLEILITQLQNQDPTKPMEDREFIAQMAQFSSLEQMTNISKEFGELSATLKGSQALNLVGRSVEITRGENIIRGTVDSVTGGRYPQLLVGGTYYNYDEISRVNKD